MMPGLPGTAAALELAVVVPTFNEIGNVDELIARLTRLLGHIRWELVFVDDDSRDGTSARLHEISRSNPQVRCLRRVGRRGLSSACVEGMLATGAPCIAVMDADLQHDESLLPQMFQVLQTEPVDLVVGSRYVDGGGVAGWDASRQQISSLATSMAQKALGLT
ncbi:MAG: hypothetical protein RLZZ126_782, partial [Pseudomonadota bacterium]